MMSFTAAPMRVAPVSARTSFRAAPVAAAPLRMRSARGVVCASTAPASTPAAFVAPALDPNTPSPIFGGSTGGLLRKAQASDPPPLAARRGAGRSPGAACTAALARAGPGAYRWHSEQVEEFYVITWEGKKEQIFEMPARLPGARVARGVAVKCTPTNSASASQTGGAAIMRQGPNLLKLARKEQCMALLTNLRTAFKTDGRIYRVFPSGEVQYLHPKARAPPARAGPLSVLPAFKKKSLHI